MMVILSECCRSTNIQTSEHMQWNSVIMDAFQFRLQQSCLFKEDLQNEIVLFYENTCRCCFPSNILTRNLFRCYCCELDFLSCVSVSHTYIYSCGQILGHISSQSKEKRHSMRPLKFLNSRQWKEIAQKAVGRWHLENISGWTFILFPISLTGVS